MVELLQNEPRDDGRDMIIPFSVTVRGGELTVECEEQLLETGRGFEMRFSRDPFSEEAREYVARGVEVAIAGSCFSLDRSGLALDTVILAYRGNEEELRRYICDGTVLLTEQEISSYSNLTVFEPDETVYPEEIGACREISDPAGVNGCLCKSEPDDLPPVAAVIIDGCIVSLAAVNGAPSNGEAEISVDTAENFRRRGYGRSCVAYLTRELLNRGLGVKYVSFGENKPSLALAAELGFVEESRCFDAVCYRDGT